MGGAHALNDGKGNYEPTVKFILDQFNPPPMAGSSVPVTVSNDGKTLYVAKFDDGKATGDLEAWSLSAAIFPHQSNGAQGPNSMPARDWHRIVMH
ncbi:MAG: hypothetical protein CM1200mP41_25320 [Gammaproteobacteria bacterium]|nr:MAG: hypothetical protein CM1200mP41_25320 [Gammaproteobacteria bacterium]